MNSTTEPSERPGPLADVVVVDLSTTLPGAMATQFFADAGADVIFVERPGGGQLRQDPGWPGLLRGKRSVVLDIGDRWDRKALDGLLRRADVLVTTMRPRAAATLGFTAEQLAEDHPRLVTTMITGWGSKGPWSDYKGYEGLIYAKTGVLHSKRQLTPGNDPAYVSVPYASYSAGQIAVQGTLAALIERESSGLGQVVEATLVSGVGALDPYNWFYEMILRRYPDAFEPLVAAFDDQGRPQSRLMSALLVAASKEGTWLQFAHTAPRLLRGWMEELDLGEVFTDPKWEGFPDLPTAELRQELWLKMLAKVGERTLAEWEDVFERNTNIFGEQLRTPSEALEHPQVRHDGRSVTIDDPDLGPVRQVSTLVHADGAPLSTIRRAPRIGEHTGDIRRMASSEPPLPDAADAVSPAADCPLSGVTVLELGGMFAGPFGATVLGEFGARVIKVEPLDGDMIRGIMAFPEAGAAKVLQGKESIAVDLRTPEGLSIVLELAKRADIVLQCFRAGVAERAGVDEVALKAVNPDLVYVHAPGFGTSGPYGGKPAYAPSIAAASGVTMTDAPWGGKTPRDNTELQAAARNLYAGGSVPAVNTDGLSALAVASAMALGLYAKRRGISMNRLETTMLGSSTHALVNRNTDYAGRPPHAVVDKDFRGLGPLYRLYQAADGWIFLAAPDPAEWPVLVGALDEGLGLDDDRFTTPEDRQDNAEALGELLEELFAARTKAHWESSLTARDIGCVAVAQESAEWRMQTDEFHSAGFVVDAVSPIFDEHRRAAPLSRFSRSTTRAEGGCTVGQHTVPVLRELGFDDGGIDVLRAKGVIR